MEWTAIPFDWKPRALLHNAAHARVFPPWVAVKRGLGHARCVAWVRARALWEWAALLVCGLRGRVWFSFFR